MKKISLSWIIAITVLLSGCTTVKETINQPLGEGVKNQEFSSDIKKVESIKNEIIIDNELIKITITGLNEKNDYGNKEINIEIENRTNTDINVNFTDVSVNGLMAELYVGCNITANKKIREILEFSNVEIDKLANIEGFIYVYDANTYTPMDNYSFSALRNENIEEVKESKDGKVLIENDYIKVLYLGKRIKNGYFPGIKLEVINKTEDFLFLTSADVSVDGYMSDSVLACEIVGGKIARPVLKIQDNTLKNFYDIDGYLCVFKEEMAGMNEMSNMIGKDFFEVNEKY